MVKRLRKASVPARAKRIRFRPEVLSVFMLLLIWGVQVAWGQSARTSESAPDAAKFGAREGHGTRAFDGTIIDSIVIEPRNIYNTTEPRYDRWVFRVANALHYVTRQKVIRRELLFRTGDPFSLEIAEEIGRNLRTRLALNDAWVAPEVLPNGHLLVRVVTVDKWSLVGGVQVQREGNRTSYQFGFEERNLLGNHQFLSFDYFVREQERNYVELKFIDRRFWGHPIMLTTQYSNDPIAGLKFVELRHPYYNLSQTWEYFIGTSRIDQRNDLYHHTVKTVVMQERGDILNLGAGYRWGSYYTKFGLRGDYRYVFTHFYNGQIISPADTSYIAFPQDTLYHRLGLTGEYSTYVFTRVARLDGMQYAEDLTLGFSASIGIGRKFTAGFDDYLSDQMRTEFSYSGKWGGNIVMAGYSRDIEFRESLVERRGSGLSIKYYNMSVPWITVACRSLYISETRSDGGNTLVLGGLTGIRGYDQFYRTGDRMHVMNGELRFFPNIEFLSLIFGGAAFVDMGRTWESDGSTAGYDFSFGLGARVSLEKLSKGELLRIDLARGQRGAWQLSLASHQYF